MRLRPAEVIAPQYRLTVGAEGQRTNLPALVVQRSTRLDPAVNVPLSGVAVLAAGDNPPTVRPNGHRQHWAGMHDLGPRGVRVR